MGSGGSGDIYRANPARKIEKIAAATVRAWLGSRGALEDASQGGGPDFWIEYHDGRRAVGEVSWHEDAEIQKMWKATFKQERHQIVPLLPDSGQWGVGLVRGAQIKALYQNLPALIAALAARGRTRLEPAYLHPRDPLRLTAERLGISYIQRVEGQPSPSQAIFFLPSSGGVVPPDAESVVAWLESVIADPAYYDVTAKLLKVPEMDERHVFIMSGSQTPFGVNERLSRISDVLPRRAPTVPLGITHVWGISRWATTDAGSYATLWNTDDGWSLVAVPTLDATLNNVGAP